MGLEFVGGPEGEFVCSAVAEDEGLVIDEFLCGCGAGREGEAIGLGGEEWDVVGWFSRW